MPKAVARNSNSRKNEGRKDSIERAVIYPEVKASVCVGKEAITAEQAKDLLGWEEEGSGKYGNDFLLKDAEGKKVRCSNNVSNREFNASLAMTWASDILHRRWRLNGETLIFGKTGLCLSAQHRLVGLILANQLWVKDPERWKPYWETPPVLETILVTGVNEEDDTVNTIDTARPRGLHDVFFRGGYFADLGKKERSKASRILEYAIKTLWDRTGAKLGAFDPSVKRTHQESVAFFQNHPKLRDCVTHILQEDGEEKRIAWYVGPGYASGLMYLMATAKSDREAYFKDRRESSLDDSLYDKACDFWVLLAAKAPETQPIRTAIAKASEEGGTASVAERVALICKAWECYVEGTPITAKELELAYTRDDEGVKQLAECPTVGGIDLGKASEADDIAIIPQAPSRKEIKQRAQKVREGRSIKEARERKGSQATPGKWSTGDKAWVLEDDGERYFGELLEDPYESATGVVTMVRSADGDWEVRTNQLHLIFPPDKAQPQMPKAGKVVVKDRTAKPARHPKGLKPKWAVGQAVWAERKDDQEAWSGRIVDLGTKAAKVKVAQGFQGAGSVRTVDLQDLREKQPKAG